MIPCLYYLSGFFNLHSENIRQRPGVLRQPRPVQPGRRVSPPPRRRARGQALRRHGRQAGHRQRRYLARARADTNTYPGRERGHRRARRVAGVRRSHVAPVQPVSQ